MNETATSTTRRRSPSANRSEPRENSQVIASKITLGAKVAKYIALRYTYPVAKEITTVEYQSLAELRYLIRKFVGEGDAVARAAGLEPQQYQLLFAFRCRPKGEEPPTRPGGALWALKHHRMFNLIDP